jgi:hypothetical protein
VTSREAPRLTTARRAEHARRDRRLAEALRANLLRRKEQARARDDAAPPEDATEYATEPQG